MSQIPFSSLVDKIRNGNDNDIDNDDDDDNAMIGLTLILIIVLFLFALVAIRFLCNCLFIDIVLLSDYSTIKKLKERLIFLLCCCRTTGNDNNDDDDTSDNSDDGNNNDDALEMANTTDSALAIKDILMCLTSKQKRDVLSSVLVSKMVTENDLNDWKSKSGTSIITIPDGGPTVVAASAAIEQEQLNFCCPICINDVKVGEQIYICHNHTTSEKHNNIDCRHHHHFHLQCIVDWLSTGSTVCPYCRRVILTQDMVLEEISKQNNNSSTKQTTTTTA
ncbi:hypothetical protein FRACYDRAFT_247056 [Fragilariopsis cylindrus CCMP1102]|uniref:RING-type domain-containing protein n=1 Tax=Fragilariopsis cylindrus CCMP1102 TaxID=635003 RepID=A0A1E7EXH5_9STRA|nr:hypothetical protein FRACYDRAFT_247056 [Fragilariopsis cylindrus CCMP1102]|eukprot:OEU10515.1 hypothetical protein FRACYDRAFT_247056 [Fragilariopsis cylindrus CCMP1102]